MIRNALTIARLFRHEWPSLALLLLAGGLAFGLVAYVSMKGVAV